VARGALRLGVFAIAALIVWQLLFLRYGAQLFPGPLIVGAAIVKLALSGVLVTNLAITLRRVLIGFALATAAGIPLGLILASKNPIAGFIEPIVPVLQTVPSTGWALVAVIWFGLSDATPVFVVFVTSLPVIAVNTYAGVQSVNADWLQMARSFHMTPTGIVRAVMLPAILPYLLAAVRLAFGYGWRISGVAEALGSSSGVGYQILSASNLIHTELVLAWIVVGVLTMLVIEYGLLRPLEQYLFRWRREAVSS
jgi:NitT/TauT family transport system permease protein